MWKVISVDDELLVRNHLRYMIRWEEHGYSWCGEAGDGMEAMKLVDEVHPDLAIVDMNMPAMDGVELIQRLSEKDPSLQIIALSSYDSYDYVRGSLSFGAVDYLLKHRLTVESLTAVLCKVQGRLEAERKLQSDRQKELQKWELASSALSQTYLKELLLGVAPDIGKYREHFQDMPYGRDGQQHVLLLMKLLNFELLLSRMQDKELTLLIRSISDLCGQIAGETGCVVYMEQGTFALLLSMGDGRSENTILQWVSGCISRIRKSVKLYFNSAPIFAESALFSTVEALAGQYSTLMRRLDDLQGRPSYGEESEEPSSYLAIHQEKELLAAAEACDTVVTEHILREMFASLSARGGASPRAIGRLTAELMQLAAKIAQKESIDAEWIFRQMADVHKLSADPLELERSLIHIYETLIGKLREAQLSHGYSRYIAQAIRHIQSSYKEGLTLDETAELLGITPAYLSRLFKEETGSTFTEYLTVYRIERSKQLIRTQAIPVKHIFQQVGFNSYSYFIKVFKEHTGETPHVYAERGGK